MISLRTALASLVLFITLPHLAIAQTQVSTPDDICAPTDDPCIIDQVYEVQAPGSLNFGSRTLRFNPGGRLLQSVSISCGQLEIEVGTGNIAIDSSESGGEAGVIDINVAGSAVINGKLQARGNPGGEISVYAEGDLTINGRLLADGSPIGSDGGSIVIVGEADVTITENLIARSVKGDNYDTVSGGLTFIDAVGNLNISGEIQSGGGHSGGLANLDAYGTVTISNDIVVSAGAKLREASGGYIYIYSDAGISITEGRLSASGATGYYVSPYGYKYAYAGYGGLHMIRSDYGDINISPQTKLYANGGPNAPYSSGGWLFLYAYNGKVQMNGDFTGKGYGPTGRGGYFFVSAYNGIETGPSSNINLRAKYAGYARLLADYDYSYNRLDGTLDLRGLNKIGNSDYAYYGDGGYFTMEAADLVMDGKILGGADGSPGDFSMQLCRFHALSGTKIDVGNGEPLGDGSLFFSVEEHFITDQGSTIHAAATGGGSIDIDFRSAKPPVLNGDMQPDPLLNGSPGGGCPVCGNSEIDAGESCDDGNLSSGDNCNDECQDEGCIAATPGYPGVPLCSDGDACTVDLCDPVAHTCSNILSCEEGIACTVDSCVSGACEHTPDDSLCNDFNECTADVCNATTGCVYADLDAVPCEDGDLCTLTGTCASGSCVATDEVKSTGNSMKFRFKAEASSDKFSYKGELPLTEYTANPAVTGLTLELRDSNNQTVISALIPNTSFEDKDGTGNRVRFRDKLHLLPTGGGISQISISESPSKGVAKVKIKGDKSDFSGAEGEFRLSLSMLFGGDPSTDDCLTARFVPCTPKEGKNRCKDPKN